MKKKRKIGNILLTVVLVGVAALLVIVPFWMERATGAGKDAASILSAAVETATIRDTVAGSGSITDADAVDVTIPDGVKLKEYVVKNGDTVKAGDPLAIVDETSVMNVIAKVRADLDEIESDMADARQDTAGTDLKTDVAGRVKTVYANAGDSVRSVMDTYGALAVVSLDGLMVTTVETSAPLAIGDRVTVIREDGVTELEGSVELARNGVVTVTVTDEDTRIGETVTVLDKNGAAAGSGTLDVHSAWNVTAWSGTVKLVKCSPEQAVKANALLFRLENTDYASDYKQLTDKHRDYEELMFDLFQLYADGLVLSDTDGKVDNIDKDNTGIMLASAKRSSGLTLMRLSARGGDALLSTHSPDREDQSTDTGYTNYYAAVIAANEDGTYTVMRSAAPVTVADYTSVSTPKLADLTGTPETVPPFAVYTWTGDAWKKTYKINVGDTFVFAYDGTSLLWAVSSGQSGEIPSGGGGGENPFGPGGWGGRGWGGFSFGGWGGSSTEKEYEYTSLDRVTVMTVTPQDKVSVTMSIDELDILSVSLGQQAQVTLDAVPGQSFTGTVTKIETTGSNAGGNSKFTVTMELDRTAQMVGGMNVSALLTVGTHENVPTLPAEALAEEGGKTFVYTAYDEENGLSGKKEVTTGASDGLVTEIVSGLKAGDSVWYAYYDTLEVERQLAGMPGGFYGGRNAGNDQPGGRR